MTTSQGLKVAIGPPVVVGSPFAKRREEIIRRRARRLGHDDAATLDPAGKLAALPHAQRLANGLRIGCRAVFLKFVNETKD